MSRKPVPPVLARKWQFPRFPHLHVANRYCATLQISLNQSPICQNADLQHGRILPIRLPSVPVFPSTAMMIAVFSCLPELIPSDNPRQRPIGPTADWLPTTPTYMVCRGYRPSKSNHAAQPSRYGLPHAFGLNARLRAFSSGYRVLPIPNRHGQSPKSPKSAASGYRRRPTRGGTTGFKRHLPPLLRFAHDMFPIGRFPPADFDSAEKQHSLVLRRVTPELWLNYRRT